jgi:hypothetical protein
MSETPEETPPTPQETPGWNVPDYYIRFGPHHPKDTS